MLAFVLGAGLVWHFSHRQGAMPDAPALLLKVREVARLETLDVSLYKKIDFAPDPREQSTFWASLAQWAQFFLTFGLERLRIQRGFDRRQCPN